MYNILSPTNVCIYSRLGDQIVSVNGVSLMTVQHADAVQALKDSGRNVVLVSNSHSRE